MIIGKWLTFRDTLYTIEVFAWVCFSGRHYLGFGRQQQVRGQSWYNLIHPEDVLTARCKHDSREHALIL